MLEKKCLPPFIICQVGDFQHKPQHCSEKQYFDSIKMLMFPLRCQVLQIIHHISLSSKQILYILNLFQLCHIRDDNRRSYQENSYIKETVNQQLYNIYCRSENHSQVKT